MKLSARANLLLGILFTLILGILLHFFYDWSGENPFVALFAPVNESVWEHLKLLFFPAFAYTLFEIIVLFKTSGSYLTARICGLLLGMFFIVSAFFTYTGISGRSFLVLDILIFVISVFIAFSSSRYIEVHYPGFHLPLLANFALLLLLVILFFSFTFSPPQLPLYQPLSQISYFGQMSFSSSLAICRKSASAFFSCGMNFPASFPCPRLFR